MAGQHGVRAPWGNPAQQGETDALRRGQRQNETKGWPAPLLQSLPVADASWLGRIVMVKNPVTTDLSYAYICMLCSDGTYQWSNIAVSPV